MGTSHRAGEVRGADYQDLRRKSLLKSTSDNDDYRTPTRAKVLLATPVGAAAFRQWRETMTDVPVGEPSS